MSFDDFILYKGLSIKQASRLEAYHYIIKYGERSTWKDYIWLSYARDAFWRAMYWTKRAEDLELTLHTRCSSVRAAKGRTHSTHGAAVARLISPTSSAYREQTRLTWNAKWSVANYYSRHSHSCIVVRERLVERDRYFHGAAAVLDVVSEHADIRIFRPGCRNVYRHFFVLRMPAVSWANAPVIIVIAHRFLVHWTITTQSFALGSTLVGGPFEFVIVKL